MFCQSANNRLDTPIVTGRIGIIFSVFLVGTGVADVRDAHANHSVCQGGPFSFGARLVGAHVPKQRRASPWAKEVRQAIQRYGVRPALLERTPTPPMQAMIDLLQRHAAFLDHGARFVTVTDKAPQVVQYYQARGGEHPKGSSVDTTRRRRLLSFIGLFRAAPAKVSTLYLPADAVPLDPLLGLPPDDSSSLPGLRSIQSIEVKTRRTPQGDRDVTVTVWSPAELIYKRGCYRLWLRNQLHERFDSASNALTEGSASVSVHNRHSKDRSRSLAHGVPGWPINPVIVRYDDTSH